MTSTETTIRRVQEAVDQYKGSPFRSADWLANEIMSILDTVPANDILSRTGYAAGIEAAAKVADYRAHVWKQKLTPDLETFAMSLMEECEDIATAIRALASMPRLPKEMNG